MINSEGNAECGNEEASRQQKPIGASSLKAGSFSHTEYTHQLFPLQIQRCTSFEEEKNNCRTVVNSNNK